jgi:hypothetical protein
VSITKLKTAYTRAKAAETKAKLRAKASLLSLIETCPHADVLEGEYRPSDYGLSSPPFRVCTTCGLAEEGWGCGYTLLASNATRSVTEAKREHARKSIVVFLNNDTAYGVSRGRNKLSEVML